MPKLAPSSGPRPAAALLRPAADQGLTRAPASQGVVLSRHGATPSQKSSSPQAHQCFAGPPLQAVSYVSRRRMDSEDFDPNEVDEDGLPLVGCWLRSPCCGADVGQRAQCFRPGCLPACAASRGLRSESRGSSWGQASEHPPAACCPQPGQSRRGGSSWCRERGAANAPASAWPASLRCRRRSCRCTQLAWPPGTAFFLNL